MSDHPSGWQQRIAAHWMSEAERLKTLAERHPSGSAERIQFYSHRERLIACAEDVVKPQCSCPTTCDCANPEPKAGAGAVSEECPVHNWKAKPALTCPVHGEDACAPPAGQNAKDAPPPAPEGSTPEPLVEFLNDAWHLGVDACAVGDVGCSDALRKRDEAIAELAKRWPIRRPTSEADASPAKDPAIREALASQASGVCDECGNPLVPVDATWYHRECDLKRDEAKEEELRSLREERDRLKAENYRLQDYADTIEGMSVDVHAEVERIGAELAEECEVVGTYRAGYLQLQERAASAETELQRLREGLWLLPVYYAADLEGTLHRREDINRLLTSSGEEGQR